MEHCRKIVLRTCTQANGRTQQSEFAYQSRVQNELRCWRLSRERAKRQQEFTRFDPYGTP